MPKSHRMSSQSSLRILLLLPLVLASWPAGAADAAHDWLMRMNRAARDLSYDGVFVYLHADQVDTMRIVHRVQDGSVQERLVSLNGPAREVIRDAQQVWCYLPDKNLGVQEFRRAGDPGFPSVLPERIEVLDQNYSLSLGKKGRFADRAAQLIIVRPNDTYRYGYHLWADSATGLLLKADLVDQNGHAIEQYLFTEIRIGGRIAASELKPRTPRESLVWHGETRAPAAAGMDDMWKVTNLPPGFMLSSSIQRQAPMRNTPVRHLVYSDGLAAVSVFIEKAKDPTAVPATTPTRMGAVHALAVVVGGHQVTVVGEVPAATVEQIGKSVRHMPVAR